MSVAVAKLRGVIVFLCVCMGLQASNDDLLFYASFDKGFDADVAKGGNPVALMNKNMRLVPGLKGKAALVKGSKDYVQYSASGGCINGSQGSFVIWVKPINWTPSVQHFVFLAGAVAVSGSDRHDIYIFKNRRCADIQFLVRKRNVKNGTSHFAKAEPTWNVGSWHQLAVTWKDKLYKYYIDGREVATRGGPLLPDKGWNRIKVGFLGGSWPSVGDETTAIDEVRIFGKPLSAEQIKTEYDACRKMLQARGDLKKLSPEKRSSFYVPCDNSLANLSEHKNNLPVKIRGGSGLVQYVPGVIKQAAVLNGPDRLRAHYNMTKKLELPEGTCSLWIKPLDWDKADKKMQQFVSFFSGNGRVFLYKRQKEILFPCCSKIQRTQNRRRLSTSSWNG